MQYQVFVQSQSDQRFVASIIGMPQVAVAGVTEVEAIAKVKAALESQLAMGKIVTIEVGVEGGVPHIASDSGTKVNPAGVFVDDPTFEDWMEKLTSIRESANQVDDLG